MEMLKLIDGKFFKGDKEVPIEIGNKEQIELYKRSLNRYSELIDGVKIGFDYDININYNFSVYCPCGHVFYINEDFNRTDWDLYHGNDIYGSIENDILDRHSDLICPKCGKKYYISFDPDDDEITCYLDTTDCKFNKEHDNISDQILGKSGEESQ